MKNVLITGVSGGMGFATAKKFSENGFNVIGLDINEPKETLNNFTFFHCDLTKINSVEETFEDISKNITNLDLLISFAGIYDLNSLVEISEEDFVRIFNINLFGVYRLNKTFLPLLTKNSKIIITSSELAPLDPLPFTGIYGITKTALEKYAYSLRMELQLLDIQVVVIRPGAVETQLLDISTNKVEKFKNNTKLYRHNADKFNEIVNGVESRKISANKIADLAYKISSKRKPKYIYNINRNPLLKLLNILPKRLANYIILKLLKSRGK